MKDKSMALAEKIEGLKDYPATAPSTFREQLDRARESREQLVKQDGEVEHVRGIDRSGELTPMPRPVIVRTISPSV